MIKLAALSLTIFLIGCSSVPHVEEVNATEEMTFPVTGYGRPVMMAPPPPPPLSMAVAPMREEFIDLRTGDPGPQPEEKHKAAKFATKVVGSILSAANAATITHETTITKDPSGNVIQQQEVIKEDSMLGKITKIVGLITGMLGLYVGAKTFKEKFYAPISTKPKRRPGPRVI